MEYDILNLLSEFSIETLIISTVIFLMTMIIKYPIKKSTHKVNETKRKTINSVIVLIPALLSTIITISYYKISYNLWFSPSILKIIISSWLLSLSIYSIYERLKLILVNFINKKSDDKLIQDTKKEIKSLLSKLKLDKESMSKLQKEIDFITNENKKNIESKNNLTTIFESNIEIANLNDKKISLEKEIKELQNKIKNI